ncbi:hypothetical protein C2E23DRAFT_890380 [Lenzites betulinus]|nr:hypothetical protein C2E23DRAFT_890380 [Lenzites betulinus]
MSSTPSGLAFSIGSSPNPEEPNPLPTSSAATAQTEAHRPDQVIGVKRTLRTPSAHQLDNGKLHKTHEFDHVVPLELHSNAREGATASRRLAPLPGNARSTVRRHASAGIAQTSGSARAVHTRDAPRSYQPVFPHPFPFPVIPATHGQAYYGQAFAPAIPPVPAYPPVHPFSQVPVTRMDMNPYGYPVQAPYGYASQPQPQVAVPHWEHLHPSQQQEILNQYQNPGEMADALPAHADTDVGHRAAVTVGGEEVPADGKGKAPDFAPTPGMSSEGVHEVEMDETTAPVPRPSSPPVDETTTPAPVPSSTPVDDTMTNRFGAMLLDHVQESHTQMHQLMSEFVTQQKQAQDRMRHELRKFDATPPKAGRPSSQPGSPTPLATPTRARADRMKPPSLGEEADGILVTLKSSVRMHLRLLLNYKTWEELVLRHPPLTEEEVQAYRSGRKKAVCSETSFRVDFVQEWKRFPCNLAALMHSTDR